MPSGYFLYIPYCVLAGRTGQTHLRHQIMPFFALHFSCHNFIHN